MLRSIAASSSWRFSVITVTQASQTTSATLRVKKLELSLISFPMRWEEGHISHCSRVLRRCHPEPSSCSGEFGCRSFIIPSPWTVCEKTCVILWATIRLILLNISLSNTVLETKNLREEVLNSTCRTTQVCKLSQNVNFDDLEFNGFGTLMVWHFWQL